MPLSAEQAALRKGEKIQLTSLGLSQTTRIIAQTSIFFVVLANRFGGVFLFFFFQAFWQLLGENLKKPINGSMCHRGCRSAEKGRETFLIKVGRAGGYLGLSDAAVPAVRALSLTWAGTHLALLDTFFQP